MLPPKLRYFLTCASKLASVTAFHCPSCGGSTAEVVSRKYLITSLRRCSSCLLLFRTPTTTPEENAQFYQEEYRQGFTSDTPTDEELPDLLRTGFKSSEKDYTTYLSILQALGVSKGARILDYGCSWGYGSWQLQAAGYEVTAFEISKPRCRYAREKLGIKGFDSLEPLQDQKFDVFFSAHVLEHVPSVLQTIKFAHAHLLPGGLFVAFTPNGSEAYRIKNPGSWMKLWGLVHPNFLCDEFYLKINPRALLMTAPYDLETITRFKLETRSAVRPILDGIELLAVWRS